MRLISFTLPSWQGQGEVQMMKKISVAKVFTALLVTCTIGIANAAIVQSIRTSTGTVNFPNSVTVWCAAGEIVTGGGYVTNAQLGSAMKSYPVISGSQQGWSVQPGANNVTITAHAICIKEQ
jgi:hypothetical protein